MAPLLALFRLRRLDERETQGKTETVVRDTVRRIARAAVRRPLNRRVVVPTATTEHAARAHANPYRIFNITIVERTILVVRPLKQISMNVE